MSQIFIYTIYKYCNLASAQLKHGQFSNYNLKDTFTNIGRSDSTV